MFETHVFLSRPTAVTRAQKLFLAALDKAFAARRLQIHTVGTQDFTNKAPLLKILEVMAKCDGACILGLVQAKAERVEVKPDTEDARTVEDAVFPTPWNQLEAGMAMARGLPLFVICERGVGGGIFDDGAGDVYVHRLRVGLSRRWLATPEFVQSIDEWITTMHRRLPAR
jgi:hypothetical protein